MELFIMCLLLGISNTIVSGLEDVCGSLTIQPKSPVEGESVIIKLTTSKGLSAAGRRWIRYQPGNSASITIFDSNSTSTRSGRYSEKKANDGFILRIYPVTIDDSGSYGVAFHTMKCSQIVHLPVAEISETKDTRCGDLKADEYNVTEGTDVVLVLLTYPGNSSIIWQKENTLNSKYYFNLFDSAKYKIEQSNNSHVHTLIIVGKVASYEDSGKYRVNCEQVLSQDVMISIAPVPPTKPRFLGITDIQDCNKCLPAQLSQNSTAQCVTFGGTEPVDFRMLLNGKDVTTTVEITSYYDVPKRSLRKTFQPTNEDTVFTCTVKNVALQLELSESARVFIFVSPTKVTINNVTSVKENQIGEIQCDTEGGRPPLQPKLIIAGQVYQAKVHNTIHLPTDQTFNVQFSLMDFFNRSHNNVPVQCCVDVLQNRTCSEQGLINVLFPPDGINIKASVLRNQDNGDTDLELNCTVNAANPRSHIEWMGVQTFPHTSMEPLYWEDPKTRGVSVSMVMKLKLTKQENRREFGCSAVNKEFNETRKFTNYTANITYAPVINGPEHENITAYIGARVVLSCLVDGNPKPTVFWHSQQASLGKGMELIFQNVSVNDSRNYECIATNNIGGFKRKIVALFVKDPPFETAKTSSNDRSGTSNSLTGPVVGGVVATIVVVIAGVTIFMIHKKRQELKPKERNEPNPEELVTQRAPSRDSEQNRSPTLENNDAVYSQVDKCKTKSSNKEFPEYASVAPKAARMKQNSESTQEQQIKGSETTETHLVYAELDLQTQPTTKPAVREHETTEYVTIDHAKTGSVKTEETSVEYSNLQNPV